MAMTVAELAEKLNATVAGDGTARVTHVAPLREAGPDAVAWLGDAKYAKNLAATQAAAVLVPEACDAPPEMTVIRVADPDMAMVAAQQLLAPPVPQVPPGVHPSAVVADDALIDDACIGPQVVVGSGAKIGAGTQLHAGVCVGDGVTIGAGCVIWPSVVIRERCEIGQRVIIHPNVTIGADGFGYLQRDGQHIKIPQTGTVVIEDEVEIGAGTCIDRARSGQTRIGAGTKIDNLVQIGHNVQIGPGCIVVGQCGIAGSTTLGRYVVLAGQVGVTDHIRIGDMAQIGAQAGVMQDVPPRAELTGSPALEVRHYHRLFVLQQRLPEMQAQLRDLRKRIEELESTTHDRT